MRDKYRLNLTRSLYFQNLDNNAGVLYRVLDDAHEQEFRESILAYFLLWKQAPDDGWNAKELDRAAEKLIKSWIEVDVNFEVHDSLVKLERLGLASQVNDKWQATDIETALKVLDEAWDSFYQFRDTDTDGLCDSAANSAPLRQTQLDD